MARRKTLTIDALDPDVSVLAKLASLVVHLQEAEGEGGHWFDIAAVKTLINDGGIREWVEAMQKLALAPVKRSESSAGD